jgi:hypothetical protein
MYTLLIGIVGDNKLIGAVELNRSGTFGVGMQRWAFTVRKEQRNKGLGTR